MTRLDRLFQTPSILKYYGKVDEVPGLFFVATEFWSIRFIPILPLKSVLVQVDQNNRRELRALPIRMSAKSVIVSYVREVLIAISAFCGIAGMAIAIEMIVRRRVTANEFVAAVFFVFAGLIPMIPFYFSYRWTRPSVERALKYAQQLSIPIETLAVHFVRHRISVNKHHAQVPTSSGSESITPQ